MALTPQERGALGAQKRWAKQEPESDELPKYRITAVCYLNDRIYDPDAQPKDDNGDPKPLILQLDTEWPAWYMEPANAAAQAMCDLHPPKPLNALADSLPITKAA